MNDIVIYHNPRCSKSRQTLSLLRERGMEPIVIEYLKEPPDAAALEEMLDKLGLEPRQLMRRGEAAYRERGLADPDLPREDLVRAMVEEPILIERPVVIAGERAAIGRPPEAVLEILPR